MHACFLAARALLASRLGPQATGGGAGRQVYVEVAPLPQLPAALLLVAFAGRDGYAYSRHLALLQRAARRAPDAAALAAGAAALLRQFHPAYTNVRARRAPAAPCRACAPAGVRAAWAGGPSALGCAGSGPEAAPARRNAAGARVALTSRGGTLRAREA